MLNEKYNMKKAWSTTHIGLSVARGIVGSKLGQLYISAAMSGS